MKKTMILMVIFMLYVVAANAQDSGKLTVRGIVRHQIVDEFLSESIYDGVYAPYADRVAKDQATEQQIRDVVRARQIDPEGTYILETEPYRPVNIFKDSRVYNVRIRD